MPAIVKEKKKTWLGKMLGLSRQKASKKGKGMGGGSFYEPKRETEPNRGKGEVIYPLSTGKKNHHPSIKYLGKSTGEAGHAALNGGGKHEKKGMIGSRTVQTAEAAGRGGTLYPKWGKRPGGGNEKDKCKGQGKG